METNATNDTNKGQTNARSGNRKYHPMRDPNTAPARVYIGNLAEAVTEDDLRTKFGPYGQINGILLQRGFAFLQYMAKDSAEEAIEKENKSMLHDKLIAVRTALVKPEGSMPKSDGNKANNHGNNIDNSEQKGNGPVVRAQMSAPTFVRNNSSNDVEIIVELKELTTYAEHIERRLNNSGIKVDLLYPNMEVPMGKILANIASRGTLYAVLVTTTNLQHRSVTVNILYGTPAEHRNMPVEAALTLIEQDFKKYMAQEKSMLTPNSALPSAVPIAPAAPALASHISDRHPEAIQALMYLLVDNKPLTVLQYERIIKYLMEKREVQVKLELGEVEAAAVLEKPLVPDQPKIDPAELEVQKRINDIISTPNLLETIEKKRGPYKMPKETLELLRDPRIERALDSLLSKEVFATLGL